MDLIDKIKKTYYTCTYGIQFPEQTSGNIHYDAMCALYVKRSQQQKERVSKTQRAIEVIIAMLKEEVPVEKRIRYDAIETLVDEKFRLECEMQEKNKKSDKEKEKLRQSMRRMQMQYQGTELAQMVAYAYTYLAGKKCQG